MRYNLDIAGKRILAQSTWLYADSIPYRVILVEEALLPGTGDDEDPPEIGEDKVVPCLSIWFETPGAPGEFKAGGGYYQSIEEAQSDLEQRFDPGTKWEETQYG